MRMMRKRQADGLAVTLLVILTALFMWRVVFLGQILLPLDMLSTVEPWHSETAAKLSGPAWNPIMTDAIWFNYPVAVEAQTAWQQGHALWDPNVFAGIPALARADTPAGPVYLLLSVFLPVASALSWAAVFHLLLACLFMFLLLREMGTGPWGSLIGALVFGFNSYVIDWLVLPNCIGTMAWLPLVLWAVERAVHRQNWRWVLVGALGFAAQILSGNILVALYSAITVGLLAFFQGLGHSLKTRQPRAALPALLHGGLALTIGAAITAPVLVSNIGLFGQTMRTGKIGASSFLSPPNLARLLAPAISGNSVWGDTYSGLFNYPETSLYIGVLPLVFVVAGLFSPRRKPAWAIAGLGAVTYLAVFNVFPLRQIVSYIYPVFLNTFPGRIFYVTAFCWAAAAGIGADWLVTACPARALRRLGIGTAGLTCAMLLAFVYVRRFGQPVGSGANLMVFARIVHSDSLVWASGWLAASTALLWLASRFTHRAWVWGGLALVLVVSDLFVTSINYPSTFDPRLAFPETPSLQALRQRTRQEIAPPRIVSVKSDSILPGMTSELYGLSTVTGYSSFVLQRYSSYADLTGLRSRSNINQVYFADCCTRLMDALNVKYIYAAQGTSIGSASGALSLIGALGQAQQESAVGVAAAVWRMDGSDRAVLYEHPPARISYALSVRSPVTFTTAVALDPAAWDKPGDGVLFEVYVAPKGTDRDVRLFSRYVDPKHNPADRAWLPVEVSLASYVGKDVTLRLVTSSGSEGDIQFDWAGWADPEIRGYFARTLELVYDGPNKIYENKAALPRTWLVHEVAQVPVGDQARVGQLLRGLDFDPASQAVVEGSLPSGMGRASPTDRVQITYYAPEQVDIAAELKEPGLLVLSDSMAPGWRAFVDGAEQPILTTNLIMRGLRLDSGRHHITFVYRPFTLTLGLAIAGATLLLIAVCVAAPAARSRRHTPSCE